MARRSSSSLEVLLGLLTIEPMSGYDLGLTIRSSIGFFWNESYGQIYPNLKKLAAQGLVSSRAEQQEGKPDRRIYSITNKGRERLAKWLAVEPQPEIPRNELLLKLFFGTQVSPEVMIVFVQRMELRERAVLKQIKQVEREIASSKQYPDTPYWRMTARFGQLELEAHLRWTQETQAELRNLAGKQQPAAAGKEQHRAGK
jgi:PadR family transcriptional regulator AphA